MKSYLVSYLARRYASHDLPSFIAERTEHWLVWEAGRWRPPSPHTTVVGAGPTLVAAGESLAIVLEACPGDPEIRLGRAPENDLVIDDGTLSRAHLVFRRDGGAWSVRDAGSSNGTRVDGVRIAATPVPLAPGARIDAGAVRLSFHDPGSFYVRLRAGV